MEKVIVYKDCKDLPCKELFELFLAVGWSDEDIAHEKLEKFNIGFLHSTFVFSAWDNERLIGCVRVLSDLVFRSVIFDLAVHPEYQQRGIGKELVCRCRAACPNSEWLVGTDNTMDFYKKIGFSLSKGSFLNVPCKWF